LRGAFGAGGAEVGSLSASKLTPLKVLLASKSMLPGPTETTSFRTGK
jgi:hypothetical protein